MSWLTLPVNPGGKGQRRAAITRRLAEGGVSLPGPVYEMPIHHQPVFGGAYGGLAFPEAESFSYGHLCLPLCPTTTEEEQITVAAAIVEAADAALLGR